MVEDCTYTQSIKKSKPPLGVTPRNLYDEGCTIERIQDICRALNDYANYEEINLESMIKWSGELTERLEQLMFFASISDSNNRVNFIQNFRR